MDAVNFIKQALDAGLFKTTAFAFPDGAALETLVPLARRCLRMSSWLLGTFFTTPDSEMNQSWVKSYYDRFKEWPDYMAEETYAGVYFLKAAIERAGTTDADKVIAAVEREPLAWATPEGWKIMGAQDHAVIEDVLWGQTTYSPKYGFAILKNMQAIQAEQVSRTPAELKKVQVSYERKLREKK